MPTGSRGCCPTLRAAKLPSLVKEGWLRAQTNIAKQPHCAQTGWFDQLLREPSRSAVILNQPPRLRPSKDASRCFLMAQPPLLCQGVPITVLGQSKNGKELLALLRFSGFCKRQDTVTVSVGRFPNGACEPVKESDPRPARNNIGDAQSLLDCDDPA